MTSRKISWICSTCEYLYKSDDDENFQLVQFTFHWWNWIVHSVYSVYNMTNCKSMIEKNAFWSTQSIVKSMFYLLNSQNTMDSNGFQWIPMDCSEKWLIEKSMKKWKDEDRTHYLELIQSKRSSPWRLDHRKWL